LEEAIQKGQFDVAAVIAKQLAAIKSSSSAPASSSSSDSSNSKLHHQTQTERNESQMATAAVKPLAKENALKSTAAEDSEERNEKAAKKKIQSNKNFSVESTALTGISKPLTTTASNGGDDGDNKNKMPLKEITAQQADDASETSVVPVLQSAIKKTTAAEAEAEKHCQPATSSTADRAATSATSTAIAPLSLQRIIHSSSVPSTAPVNNKELSMPHPSTRTAVVAEGTSEGPINYTKNNNEKFSSQQQQSQTMQ
jgi:hypothetical protein